MSETTPTTGATILGVAGIVLYALIGVVFMVSGLVVPAPWLFVLWAVWLVGVYLLIRVFRVRRTFTPLVALGAAVFWWLYVSIGSAIFDWTA